jgi:hypothetical protein
MLEYILCYGGPAKHRGLLPATRLASRKILIEQNIKKRTGPALCVLCGLTNCQTKRRDNCGFMYSTPLMALHVDETLFVPIRIS